MQDRTGAQEVVESLHREGIRTLFGIPGVDTLGVYNALLDQPDIKAINVRHEQSAVFMADGFYRSSGEIGVALTSGGPGALNTMGAMACAHNDSSAVLQVVNENPAHVRRKGLGYFHDLSDQMGMFRPVTDFVAQPTLASEIAPAINQAMGALRNRRPRPAMVEIAGEAFVQTAKASDIDPVPLQRLQPLAAQLDAAAALIRAAKRPVFWAGGGVIASDACQELLELVEELSAPVLTSQAGKGSFPPDHPLHIGNWANERPVRELLEEADLLVAVGTRFSYFPTGGWSLELPETIVQIDLDPAEIGRNYRVAAPVVGDARPALRGIADRVGKLEGAERLERGRWERKAEGVRNRITAAVGTPPPEVEMLDQLRAALPSNTRVFNDPTTIAFWARSYWKALEPRTWFVPSGMGTLGFALPAAIGAKFATPDIPSVAVIGDAGVMFTIQDLMTAVEHEISVIVLVFNDRGYGVERRHMDHLYGRQNGVELLPPDFVALAKSFGAHGVRVELDGVGAAIDDALNRGGPVLIEIPNNFGHPGYGSWVDWDNV
ncbi:MAG: thiamine pyrophosphate-binding protein [Acidimicrobiia bacterium]|nr:thiamine pyrophosphate-binding protein [Acidimicrobiia bacterium]